MDPSARSAGRWKIDALKCYIDQKCQSNSWVPFMSINETWLKPYIKDAQISIPSYNIFRADRNVRTRGGSLLYVHEDIPITNYEIFDDRFCQAIICTSSRNIILASVYRPPHAPLKSFCDMVNFLQNYLLSNSNDYQIIITGDLNFPNVTWEDLHIGYHTYT